MVLGRRCRSGVGERATVANGVCGRSAPMPMSSRHRRAVAADLLVLARVGNPQEGRAAAGIQGIPAVRDVSIKSVIITRLDDLARACSRINETIGRVIASGLAGTQVDDRYAGPVMAGRGVDNRHPAVHLAAGCSGGSFAAKAVLPAIPRLQAARA